MTGFRSYRIELSDLDHEIQHYALLAGLDPEDSEALGRVFHDHAATGIRQKLRALLILRVTVEAEMLS